MVGQSASRLQVSGFRFLLRRTEDALVRGDVSMRDDPLRAQSLSLVVGAIVSVIGLLGCVALALLRPPAALGDAQIVTVGKSGALYVRIGDTMHPVLNLASARLIVGAPAEPAVVSAAAVNNAKRGPMVGIAGAPAVIAAPLRAGESAWTVCDDRAATTVIAGIATDLGVTGLPDGRGVLVTPRGEVPATTYLLYAGWRAEVDLRSRAVVRALRLDGVVPQPVSRTLLDAIPEAPAIAVPTMPAAGSPGPAALRDYAVGSVVRVVRSEAVEYYVVLVDGVQRIGAVTADLLRFVDSRRSDVPTVAPAVIGSVRQLDALPTVTFPDQMRVVDSPVICARWRPDKVAGTGTTLMTGDSLSSETRSATVALADNDAEDSRVDGVVIPSGRSAYLYSVGITGADTDTRIRYLVDDYGVVYGVHDRQAATSLGLAGDPVPGPWPVLAHLPRGPELSTSTASTVRDGLGPTS